MALVMLIVGLYIYNKNNSYKYKWSENYAFDSDQPYGTEIVYNLLDDYFPDYGLEINNKGSIESFLRSQDSTENATYVLIGGNTHYSNSDILALKNFVKKGNTIFMSVQDIPYEFLEMVNRRCGYEYLDYYYPRGKNVYCQYTNEALKSKKPYRFHYEYGGKPKNRSWHHFMPEMCDSILEYSVLSYLRPDLPNYIKIPYEKGQILIHSNPLMFSNLHMIRPESAEYASKAFSYFNEGPIYWDKFSKLWSFKPRTTGNEDQTPFTYILKQRSFKWAYYLIWGLVIVFLAFNLWRKQRPIPVKFFNENSSLEFIKTVGELYFSAKDNRKLAKQKMDYFLKWARQKYYINERTEEKFIEKFTKKSAINKADILAIFKQYKKIQNTSEEINDSFLKGFYKNIEQIKKNSK